MNSDQQTTWPPARADEPIAAPAARTVFVKSYGCQMNVYDAQRMEDMLARDGYAATQDPVGADLVILNTCHIREKAAEKVYSELGRLRVLKREAAARGRPMAIVVAGCVAQAEGDEIVRRAPAVDVVVGPQNYHRLPVLLDRAARGLRAVETEFAVDDKFAALPQPATAATRRRGVTAFVTVQEGCDKFCTFCVVPYTRGAEVSRPAAAVLAEAEGLAAAGVREITLLGQNVNAYSGADSHNGSRWDLARLLRRMAEIPGIARLRYTTSHPRDMGDDLVAAHGELPALMPYLHLPVQSGADLILAAMNRRHTGADYLRLVARLRAAQPDLALSSDFIVGFPGETDADFRATLDLVEEVGFAAAFSFKYSPRPGTPAADMADQVREAVKTERLAVLQAAIARAQAAFNRACVARTLPVLFEHAGRRPGQIVGRSPYLQPVHVEASAALIGTVADVTITAAHSNSLFAALASGPVPLASAPPDMIYASNDLARAGA